MRISGNVRKNGKAILKKFATSKRFMKKMRFDSFNDLWMISSVDTRFSILETVDIYNEVYHSNYDISIDDVRNSKTWGSAFCFKLSCFRDDINEQIVMMVHRKFDYDKGICFTIPITSENRDIAFFTIYNNSNILKLAQMEDVKEKICKSIVYIIKDNSYTVGDRATRADIEDCKVVVDYRYKDKNNLLSGLITIVKPK